MRRLSVFNVLLATSLALGWPLAGRATPDHDRARAALMAGEVLPLPTILERVAKVYPGHVLEVELERENRQWLYELKILQTGGDLIKLEVDAKDGRVLKHRKGRN